METSKPKTVDEYIAVASPLVKEHLTKLRIAILSAAPDAQEGISYEMPVYKQEGAVVFFGGFTKHVSLFPGPEAIAALKEELAEYKTSAGTIQFPVSKPIPVTLVKKIVKLRVKANLLVAKAKAKEKEKKAKEKKKLNSRKAPEKSTGEAGT